MTDRELLIVLEHAAIAVNVLGKFQSDVLRAVRYGLPSEERVASLDAALRELDLARRQVTLAKERMERGDDS